MTAISTVLRPVRRASGRLRRARPVTAGAGSRAVVPPLSPRRQAVRASLLMISGISVCFVAYVVLVSPLQQRAAQQRAYDALRLELAAGTAPLSAADLQGVGDPIGYLEVPAIGLRQVVVEGTSAGALTTGPGHRRDTAMPGHAGTSVVMGRHATYGSPFRDLDQLEPGAVITVTTGSGVVDYRVLGVRRSGEPSPAPVEAGSGRLVLATATGNPFAPSGVLLVDADLIVPPLGSAPPGVASGALPASERPMAIDGSTLWRLLLWLQALLAVSLGAVWAWHRWDPAKAWITALPPFLLVGYMAAGEAARLLPNLL